MHSGSCLGFMSKLGFVDVSIWYHKFMAVYVQVKQAGNDKATGSLT